MHLKSGTFEKKVHDFKSPYLQDPYFSGSNISMNVG